jgi:hypothetical protein
MGVTVQNDSKERLVFDRWLTLQTASDFQSGPGSRCLAIVLNLLRHADGRDAKVFLHLLYVAHAYFG